MEIENFSSKRKNKRNHNPNLPDNIRSIIVGESNCGKTNLLMNLLLKENFLDYNNLMVYGKSLFQDEYKLLKKLEELPKEGVLKLFRNQELFLNRVDEVIDYIKNKAIFKPDITVEFFERDEDILDPSEIDSTKNNIIIFDDILGEKQKTAEKYYTRGRHSNIDCFYISQDFFELPRRTIRKNSNLIILFPQNKKSLRFIHEDYSYDDMTFTEFKKLCNDIWSKDYGFLTIDKTKRKNNGKYKNKLTPIIIN